MVLTSRMPRRAPIAGVVLAWLLVLGAAPSAWAMDARPVESGGTATAAVAVSPQPIPDSATWLATLNFYRSMAGLAAVTEDPSMSQGDYMHARYMHENRILSHFEEPSRPYYTDAGNQAAHESDLALGLSGLTERQWLEVWIDTPFHAVGLLDPRLRTSGFGAYLDAGGVNVIRGLTGQAAAAPVTWPGNGMTVPLSRYGGSESPNPMSSCPGYSNVAGLPILLQLPEVPSGVTSTITSSGAPIEHCRFDGNTYANSDSAAQSVGRSTLSGRNAVVLIPRNPLTPGLSYSVAVHTSKRDVSWTFRVGYSPAESFVTAAYQDFLGRTPTGDELSSTAPKMSSASARAYFLTSLSTSQEWAGAVIDRYYTDTLGRAGDPSGRAYWIGMLRNGRMTAAQIASAFYASDEYFTRLGGGTIKSWVADLYRKLLHREPDQQGWNYWIGVAQNQGRPAVSYPFFQSTESCRVRVALLYQALLGRAPDASGQSYWASAIARDGNDLKLAVSLASSAEYYGRAGARFV